VAEDAAEDPTRVLAEPAEFRQRTVQVRLAESIVERVDGSLGAREDRSLDRLLVDRSVRRQGAKLLRLLGDRQQIVPAPVEELAERGLGQRNASLGEDLLRASGDGVPPWGGERHERIPGLRRPGDRVGRSQIDRKQRQVGPLRVLLLEDRDERLGRSDLLDAPDDEVAREGEQRQRRQVELQRPDLDLVGEVDVPFEVRILRAERRLAGGERALTPVRIAVEQPQDRFAHGLFPRVESSDMVVGQPTAIKGRRRLHEER